VLTLIPLESSSNQYQDNIKHPQQMLHFSFLSDTQVLLHIIQEVKASIAVQRGLKLLSH
jgi:hypothetical protein